MCSALRMDHFIAFCPANGPLHCQGRRTRRWSCKAAENQRGTLCNASVIRIDWPSYCHVPYYCHVIAVLLPCYCRVIAMLLPCYCRVIAVFAVWPCKPRDSDTKTVAVRMLCAMTPQRCHNDVVLSL